METPSLLQLTEKLHTTLSRLAATLPETDTLRELQHIADSLHAHALCDARQAADAAAQTRVQMDILRLEINSELVDRDANAARIAERQQFLFQRASALPGQATAAERAVASAAYVETALVSLCPHVGMPMAGCAVLDAAGS